MAAFPLLPNEIKDELIHYVSDRQDLSALSKSCKRLREATLPFLYDTVSWTWNCDRCTPEINPPIHLLLRTILHQPGLAQHVKHARLKTINYNRPSGPAYRPCDMPVLAQEHLDKAAALIQQMRLQSKDWELSWVQQLAQGSLTATLALLLSQLHELRSLRLGLDLVKRDHFVEAMFARAVTNLTPALSSFSKIQDVDLVPLLPDVGQLSDFRPWNTPRGPDYCMPPLLFPNIENAEVLLPSFSTGVFNTKAPCAHSNLVSLRMVRTSAFWAREALILSRTPHLKELTYERFSPVQSQLDWSHFSRALDHVKDSLEVLRIQNRAYWPRTDVQPRDFSPAHRFVPIGSVQKLTKLKYLEVSPIVLAGWDAHQRLHLEESLPPSLESLTLRDDCWSFEDHRWWEEVCINKLREFLRIDWRETTPNLNEISLKLYHGAARWNDLMRSQLAEDCKQANLGGGVDCQRKYDYRTECPSSVTTALRDATSAFSGCLRVMTARPWLWC